MDLEEVDYDAERTCYCNQNPSLHNNIHPCSGIYGHFFHLHCVGVNIFTEDWKYNKCEYATEMINGYVPWEGATRNTKMLKLGGIACPQATNRTVDRNIAAKLVTFRDCHTLSDDNIIETVQQNDPTVYPDIGVSSK